MYIHSLHLPKPCVITSAHFLLDLYQYEMSKDVVWLHLLRQGKPSAEVLVEPAQLFHCTSNLQEASAVSSLLKRTSLS